MISRPIVGQIGADEFQENGRRSLSRRSHLEIRMDMLRAVKGGADKPTQIMYRANLSWVVLREHLKGLVGGGFLAESEEGIRKKYELTGKGMEILVSYVQITEEMTESLSARKPSDW